MRETTCCFLGHKEICETEELIRKLYAAIENLIVTQHVDTFLFGSKSRFNSLCHEQVTRIKETYPHINRVYVRAEYPRVSAHYKDYLLKNYEETYYPNHIAKAGKAIYVERNYHMINQSRFCIVYYQETALPNHRKSGTKAALQYALQKNKDIICLP